MRKVTPVLIGLALIAAIWQLPVWDQGVERVPPDEQPRIAVNPAGGLPEGHPIVPETESQDRSSDPSAPGGVSARDGALPVTPDGLGSRAELERALAKLDGAGSNDAGLRDRFDEAFRLTFTTRRDRRDYARAKTLLEGVTGERPELAEAYRALAYCEFNLTMNFPRTIQLYERAVELDPDYGEAHYALSFMLGTNERERGSVHFERAMELGIADERNLRDRFYPEQVR